jgi:hypothetical protein
MGCPGIDITCKAKLPDIPQPLKPGMFNEVKHKIARDAYKAVNRIVNDLSFICQINHSPEFDLQKYELVLILNGKSNGFDHSKPDLIDRQKREKFL